MLGMDAGIDDEATRAEEFGSELSEPSFQIDVIPARLCSQVFGIQPPAFAECGYTTKRSDLPESWYRWILDLQCNLEVVPRYGLVIDERTQSKLRHAFLTQ